MEIVDICIVAVGLISLCSMYRCLEGDPKFSWLSKKNKFINQMCKISPVISVSGS